MGAETFAFPDRWQPTSGAGRKLDGVPSEGVRVLRKDPIHDFAAFAAESRDTGDTPMAYQGTERRIHRVFVTGNTQYHLRYDRCVAVRDVRTGVWERRHPAVNQRLSCVLTRSTGDLAVAQRLPEVGDAMCFEGSVLTSPVRSIERPPRDVVSSYAA